MLRESLPNRIRSRLSLDEVLFSFTKNARAHVALNMNSEIENPSLRFERRLSRAALDIEKQ